MNRARASGVVFQQDKIIGAEWVEHQKIWRLQGSGNNVQFSFDRLYCSNSASLLHQNPSTLQSGTLPTKLYCHGVYFFPQGVLTRQTQYLHFPDNPHIHRITLLDSQTAIDAGLQRGGQYVLIQFREGALSEDTQTQTLNDVLVQYKLVEQDSDLSRIRICAYFKERFFGSVADAPLGQPCILPEESGVVLDTIGDLGRLIVIPPFFDRKG